jgi:hypothetical protein
MKVVLGPDYSRSNEDQAIEVEHLDRSTAHCSPSDDTRPGRAPPEVIVPSVQSGIEERSNLSRARVAALSGRLLVGIAPEAAEAEIGDVIITAQGPGNDVVDRELLAGDLDGGLAILAESARSLLDSPPQGRWETAHPIRFKASARRSMTASLSRKSSSNSPRSSGVRRSFLSSNSSALACFSGESRYSGPRASRALPTSRRRRSCAAIRAEGGCPWSRS